jgi:hypothetical protein
MGTSSTTYETFHAQRLKGREETTRELWIQLGKPEGQAGALWLEAEREPVTGRKTLQIDGVLPVAS